MKAGNVSAGDGLIVNEPGLPHPWVHYPGFYGAFFGFASQREGRIRLCICCRAAAEAYVRRRLSAPRPRNAYPSREFILDSMYFPMAVVRALMEQGVEEEVVLDAVAWGEGLCHRCNRVTPTMRYCVPMYGGTFKQTYGWYINLKAMELGTWARALHELEEDCPDEILDLVPQDVREVSRVVSQARYGDGIDLEDEQKLVAKVRRRVNKVVENEVRREFGHSDIGSGWTSETVLWGLVREVFPNEDVQRHARPEWLEGLELDVYLPKRMLGVEYQGVQHYKPIKHWGGGEALRRTQERDRRKRKLCEAHGVRLEYFDYTEALTAELVRRRLVPAGA